MYFLWNETACVILISRLLTLVSSHFFKILVSILSLKCLHLKLSMYLSRYAVTLVNLAKLENLSVMSENSLSLLFTFFVQMAALAETFSFAAYSNDFVISASCRNVGQESALNLSQWGPVNQSAWWLSSSGNKPR